MGDRLFELDDYPEVPIFKEPRRSRGEHDARFRNDYPPDWNCCQTCGGSGDLIHPKSYEVERGHTTISRSAGQGANWARVTHRESGLFAFEDGSESGLVNVNAAITRLRPQIRVLGYRCPACLGMGSAKARVRLEADHRCLRCLHPYIPKGDAKMLGVESSWRKGGWSVCDEQCEHNGPLATLQDGENVALTHTLNADGLSPSTWRARIDLGDLEGILGSPYIAPGAPILAEWRILTVHHADGDKSNLSWWNLLALCQRCHLTIQSKVVLERVYPGEHTDWFKPFAAGYYAWVYLHEDVTREQAEARLDELLALERQDTPA